MTNNILVNAHSGLRWVALILLIYAIINALSGKSTYGKKDKILNLFAMISLHFQLLLGAFLYMTSAKVAFIPGWIKIEQFRFFGLEHLFGMITAIALVTLGRTIAEKQTEAINKHKKIRLYYLIGLIVILVFIPWPFRHALGGRWM